MQVLIYRSNTATMRAWDASSPREDLAFLALFRELDESDFYQMLSYEKAGNSEERKLLKLARGGDGGAARKLLMLRLEHEDENWNLIPVEKP